MDEKYAIELFKAGLAAIVSGLTLVLGWIVGQRLTYKWNIRQKRKEAQLSVAHQFYTAYGEFFAVWKLWNRLDPAVTSHGERQWELHKRAAAAEASIESLLVKLCSELTLSEDQIALLGCCRQAFQQLRQNIRKDAQLEWTYSEHPDYLAFKTLASRAATVLASDWPEDRPSAERVAQQLVCITRNDWEEAWRRKAAKWTIAIGTGGICESVLLTEHVDDATG